MTPAATNQRRSPGRPPVEVCKRGHEPNWHMTGNGRSCRTCDRTRERERYAAKRAAIAAAAAAAAPVAVPVEALDGERVDDGRRYPIDEWKRLFGDPPMLTTSYDAWAE